MNSHDDSFGMPIYIDRIDRRLPDPSEPMDTDWYPATDTTRGLWRCFEALQKIHFVLARFDGTQNTSGHKRFLINFVVPLDDFFECVSGLFRSIERDKQSKSSLTRDELLFVREHFSKFQKFVVKRSKSLKLVRNKLGAHTDKDLEPGMASRLLSELCIHSVAAKLHASLLALHNLTRLNCYAWSSRGYRDDETRLMTCEPYVLNFKTAEMGDVVGIEMTESPKRHIFELIADIVDSSSWMFSEGQSRLVVQLRPDY